MDNSKICGGIVLYNPDILLLQKNIDAVLPQLNCLVLYDNGSRNQQDIMEIAEQCDRIHFIGSKANKGVAFALNRINEYARDHGYQWVLTLDQDSICAPNMIEQYRKYTGKDKVAILCPFVLNNGKYTVKEYQKLKLPEITVITQPNDCITSAALCNVEIIDRIGGYQDNLFIDYVDTEINCRLMKNGYRIIRVNSTYLLQHMGEAKAIPLFEAFYHVTGLNLFRKMKAASVYSDKRLYYQARNSKYVYCRHKNAGTKLTPLYMYSLFLYDSLFYPISRSRIKMWKNIIKGRCDSADLF
ncbi:MAG: glycosyltransferase [Oscillospiraceae bacterium]|nr:glycosyltransferase [Oscillospiraceae bacterium]